MCDSLLICHKNILLIKQIVFCKQWEVNTLQQHSMQEIVDRGKKLTSNYIKSKSSSKVDTQLAGTVEYTNFFSAEG